MSCERDPFSLFCTLALSQRRLWKPGRSSTSSLFTSQHRLVALGKPGCSSTSSLFTSRHRLVAQKLAQPNLKKKECSDTKLKRDVLGKWNGKTLSKKCAEAVVAEAVIRLKVEKEQPELEEKLLYQLQRDKGPKQRTSHMNALIKRFQKQVKLSGMAWISYHHQ